MRRVILESPFASPFSIFGHWGTRSYARSALRDCLMRNEAPLASHLLYTQPGVLNDRLKSERALGIDAGHAWLPHADAVVAYVDYGITPGMALGIDRAREQGITVEYRKLNR